MIIINQTIMRFDILQKIKEYLHTTADIQKDTGVALIKHNTQHTNS